MIDRGGPARAGFFTLQGRGTAPGLACGPLLRNSPDLPPEESDGAVLVADRAVPDDIGRILASAGTLTVSGSLLSHVSLLSREFGKPSVALGPRCPARIVPPREDDALVELLDVVGGLGEPPVLREGDVVMIDGDAGTISIPGGFLAESRLAIRRTHAALRELARTPESETALSTLLASAEAGGEPAAAYVIEAAVLHRIVPSGLPSRRLMEALRSSRTLSDTAEALVSGARDRVVAAARSRCERALAAVQSHSDPGALDQALKSAREALRRDLERIEDLGGSPEILAGLLDPMHAEAARRREELVLGLGADVTAACELPDRAFRLRLGGLHQLARRARSAELGGDDLRHLECRLARTVADERERSGGSIVVLLADGAPEDRALVGGKAAGLLAVREALPARCRIPRGFVVTSSAYRLHVLGERGERLREAVREIRDVAALSRRARAILLGSEILEEIAGAIEAALGSLGPARLAVRSSATVEDGAAGSLAGLFDTWLGVSGLDELLHRTRLAWASLWNTRALRAMAATGLSPLDASQAVLVQEIVETRAAGVLFSRDPAGSPDTLLINATWGLGEAISQGDVVGDLYWVRRTTGEELASEAGGATSCLGLDPAGTGTIEIPLSPERAGRPCLGAGDLSRLAAVARALEEATGRAQDVEFGIAEDGGVVIFQVRRIVPTRAG
jgi:pyruvate,water dikinase